MTCLFDCVFPLFGAPNLNFEESSNQTQQTTFKILIDYFKERDSTFGFV